jgi:hypothetical protein
MLLALAPGLVPCLWFQVMHQFTVRDAPPAGAGVDHRGVHRGERGTEPGLYLRQERASLWAPWVLIVRGKRAHTRARW